MNHGVNINREIFISILLSLYEVIAINVNLDIIKGKDGGEFVLLIRDYLGSFHGFSIVHYFEWYCFYRMTKLSIPYIRKHVNTWRDYLCIGVPSVLFSLAMVIGFSFKRKHSLELFWGSSLQILKSLTMFSGYLPLFICVIICVYIFFDYVICHLHDENSSNEGNKAIRIFYNHPFRCTFILLFLISVPYIYFSYPGILMGDPAWQIRQMINAYVIDPEKGLTIRLDQIKLNNHHPVLHTIILNIFVFVGKITFDSYNLGLFLYTLFQSLCVIASISIIMTFIVKRFHVNSFIAYTFLGYYVFHPYIQQIMTLCTKDAIYSGIFIIFISVSFTKILNYQCRYQNSIWLLLAIGLILFRNEGVFLVLSMMGYWSLCCEKRLPYIYPAIVVFLFLFIRLAIFPFIGVTSGSIREALSIPFQQTARYIKFAGDEITEEEKKAISKIASFDKLADRYNGRVADRVKNTFNSKITKSDFYNYTLVWWEMLNKHPAIYVEAVLDKNYDFFYPSNGLGVEFWCDNSQVKMARLNETTHSNDFEHPQSLDFWRQYYFSLHRNIIHLPIIGILCSSAMYIWLFIIWLSFCIKKKSNQAILLLIPFLLQLLANLAGPNNGTHFRYMYTYVMGLLPTILYGMEIIRSEGANGFKH